MGAYLIRMRLVGVYLTGVHLTGVYLTVPHNDFVTDCKTICVRSTPYANSPSPELALEIAPPIHPVRLSSPYLDTWSQKRCLLKLQRAPSKPEWTLRGQNGHPVTGT